MRRVGGWGGGGAEERSGLAVEEGQEQQSGGEGRMEHEGGGRIGGRREGGGVLQASVSSTPCKLQSDRKQEKRASVERGNSHRFVLALVDHSCRDDDDAEEREEDLEGGHLRALQRHRFRGNRESS